MPPRTTIASAVIDTMIRKFRSRRDTLYEALRTIPGIVCEKPAGAFYIIAKLPIDDAEACARCANRPENAAERHRTRPDGHGGAGALSPSDSERY